MFLPSPHLFFVQLSTSSLGLSVDVDNTTIQKFITGLQINPTYKTQIDTAKTQAETSKDQAVVAKTQAETAKTLAETAKAQAQLSQEAALASQNAAATSASGAATSASGASTSASGAVTSASGAATSAGAAATSAGAAGTSAGAAATSAGAAAASAVAAAASAVLASGAATLAVGTALSDFQPVVEDPIEVHSYPAVLKRKLGVSLPKMAKALYENDQFNYMMKFKTTEAYNWDANQGQGTLPSLVAPLKQIIDTNNKKNATLSLDYDNNTLVLDVSTNKLKVKLFYADLWDKPNANAYSYPLVVTTSGVINTISLNIDSGTLEILNNNLKVKQVSYNSLSNLPSLFSGSYTDLTNKPSLFSGSYTDLTGKPNTISYSNPLTKTTAGSTDTIALNIDSTTLDIDVSTNKLKVKNSTFQPLLTVNQNSPLYLDVSSNIKIKTDGSLLFTANPTVGNSGTLSITNPCLWTKSGTYFYYNDVSTNVGIGKTNPGYTLDISGNINFTGNLTKNGATFVTDLSGYLTSAIASSTYQTQSGMSSYLTSATASSTYQTQSSMSSYLTSATASSTYQPLLSTYSSGPITITTNQINLKIDSTLQLITPGTLIIGNNVANAPSLGVANPNLWTKSGTYLYYNSGNVGMVHGAVV